MLSCLDAKSINYQKGEYILRSGDAAEALGLMLEGRALIIQEDFWGNRNIMSSIGQGQSFAETFACAPGSVLNVSVVAESACTILFLNMNRILTVCPAACAIIAGCFGICSPTWPIKICVLMRNSLIWASAQPVPSCCRIFRQRHRSMGALNLTFLFPGSSWQDYLFVDRSGLSAELCKMRDEGLLEFHRNHFSLKQRI